MKYKENVLNFKIFSHTNKTTWIIIFVCLGLLLASIPFIIHNHIYNTIWESTDLKAHSDIISNFAQGNISLTNILYPAQAVFGVILGGIDKVIPVSATSLFLGFMILVLVGAGFAIYWLFSHIDGIEKGWLVLLIAMFGCTSILALYSYGVIFSILNVYIVLMFGILCTVKWLSTHKVWYLVGALLLAGIFCVLHPTGLYLPISMVVIMAGLLVYKIVKAWKPKIWIYLIISAAILIVGAIAYLFIFRDNGILDKFDIQYNSELEWWSLLVSNLTWIIIILGITAIIGIVIYRKKIEISNEAKYLLCILAAIVITLVGAYLFGGGFQPVRIILDLSTIIAMIIGVAVVLVIKAEKNDTVKPLSIVSCILVSCGVVGNLITWVV